MKLSFRSLFNHRAFVVEVSADFPYKIQFISRWEVLKFFLAFYSMEQKRLLINFAPLSRYASYRRWCSPWHKKILIWSKKNVYESFLSTLVNLTVLLGEKCQVGQWVTSRMCLVNGSENVGARLCVQFACQQCSIK